MLGFLFTDIAIVVMINHSTQDLDNDRFLIHTLVNTKNGRSLRHTMTYLRSNPYPTSTTICKFCSTMSLTCLEILWSTAPAASYVLFCCCAASCWLHRKGYGLEGSARLYWRLYDHALSKHQQMQVGTGAAIEQRIPIEPSLDISVLVVDSSQRQLEQ